MHTHFGHLSYCTNIHPGERWEEHFAALQEFIPAIKKEVSPDQPFGIGLRLSNAASLDLMQGNCLQTFSQWLSQHDCYVFTINGFPYGGFHRTSVKDQVHAPDWTSTDRVDYTIRLFRILAELLPAGMEGSISVPPLSYRHWHNGNRKTAIESTTLQILQVVEALRHLKNTSGKVLHMNIEPEPDGLIENGSEFIDWYLHDLLPAAVSYGKEHWALDESEIHTIIREHVRLCYDVCHFAIGYEDHSEIIKLLEQHHIRIGKVQISAALKADLTKEPLSVFKAFAPFNESTYLHQVIARNKEGGLWRYPDLPAALADTHRPGIEEWRAHFHVPIFAKEIEPLQSTQQDIAELLAVHCQKPFTNHLEVETYTWEVLPPSLKLPLKESIVRELQWVLQQLKKPHA
jgi:hypothetical protein